MARYPRPIRVRQTNSLRRKSRTAAPAVDEASIRPPLRTVPTPLNTNASALGSGGQPFFSRLRLDAGTLPHMPSRPEIARLLDGLATDDQFLLKGVLESELPESDPLFLVECGDESRSLLRVAGSVLIFYFASGGGTGEAHRRLPSHIRTVRVAAPRRARITEERDVREAGAVEGSEQYPLATRLGGGSVISHSVTATTALVAAHETLPGGSIRCDCSQLSPEQRANVRDLFESWVQPRTQR